MPQANQLELKGSAATKQESDDGNDRGEKRDHDGEATAMALKFPDFLGNF
jgi:hypothetical protein